MMIDFIYIPVGKCTLNDFISPSFKMFFDFLRCFPFGFRQEKHGAIKQATVQPANT